MKGVVSLLIVIFASTSFAGNETIFKKGLVSKFQPNQPPIALEYFGILANGLFGIKLISTNGNEEWLELSADEFSNLEGQYQEAVWESYQAGGAEVSL